MNLRVVVSVVALLSAASLASAQAEFPGLPPLETNDSLPLAGPAVRSEPASHSPGRIWFSTEYLLWWMRSGPVNTPLITSGSPADAVPGALDQPGSLPFQNSSLHFGNTSGLRFSGGIGITNALAVEANYFFLEQRANGYAASASADDTSVVARPVLNAQTGTESAYATAFPGAVGGGSAVAAQTRLQGYELNLSARICESATWHFDALAGFRSMYLNEALTITDTLTPVVPGFLSFTGAPVDAGTTVGILDSFSTKNVFYGGQIGARLSWQEEQFGASISGGVALGTTQQTAVIGGGTALFAPGAPPVVATGGILAQPSNIGRWYHSSFSAVPEVGVDFTYDFTSWLRLSVGYTFLYWSGVARPGNQIDRAISPSQVPIDPGFGQGGPPRPAPPAFQQSDFWAQGIRIGLVFSY